MGQCQSHSVDLTVSSSNRHPILLLESLSHLLYGLCLPYSKYEVQGEQQLHLARFRDVSQFLLEWCLVCQQRIAGEAWGNFRVHGSCLPQYLQGWKRTWLLWFLKGKTVNHNDASLGVSSTMCLRTRAPPGTETPGRKPWDHLPGLLLRACPRWVGIKFWALDQGCLPKEGSLSELPSFLLVQSGEGCLLRPRELTPLRPSF